LKVTGFENCTCNHSDLYVTYVKNEGMNMAYRTAMQTDRTAKYTVYIWHPLGINMHTWN